MIREIEEMLIKDPNSNWFFYEDKYHHFILKEGLFRSMNLYMDGVFIREIKKLNN